MGEYNNKQDKSINLTTDNDSCFTSLISKPSINNKGYNQFPARTIMNPSLKETKCSTYIESSQRSILNTSQLEGKSSMFSQQLREINSQQNQNMIDQTEIYAQKTFNGCNQDESEERSDMKESNYHKTTQNSVKTQKSYSMNGHIFEQTEQIGDKDEEFRHSLLNATKISRINRDKLRNDLIKSNIIQNNNSHYCDSTPFDDEEEAENMFPAKSKSMLISIQNTSTSKRSGSEFGISNNIREALNINFADMNHSDQDTCSDISQQKKINKYVSQCDEIPELSVRKSSSYQALFQLKSVKSTDEEEEEDVIKELEESKQQKDKIILASAQSLPSQLNLDSPYKVTAKTISQNLQQKYHQQQNQNLDLNADKDLENESEYYDEDYHFSNSPVKVNRRESQKHEIRFHKSFFVNDQNQNSNSNNNNNVQQNTINGRSREMTENLLFNTEFNQFSTELIQSQRYTQAKNICDKMNHSSVFIPDNSHVNPSMRISTSTYDRQTSNGAISLSTFMQTKQNTMLKDWIQKRSSNLLVGWQKRWLVLKNKKLQYFKTNESTHYQGCIDFSILKCQLQRVLNKKGQLIELRISIENASKVFRFQQPKQYAVILEVWAKAILQQIDSCSKIPIRPRHITLQREFWKNDRVSLNEFESLADTGDFILFKGKTFGEKVIRNLINCEYNHIGMVLRTNNEKNNLLILEATGEEGVGLLSWKTFLKRNWQDLYHKISLRKLQAERTDDMLLKMEQFIRYAIGKSYKVSLSKLFKKKSDANQDLTEDPNRTFFCSELIATVYKVCGFLPLDVSSGHYWPSSFEGSRNLKLLKNASLSEEFILDFNI